MKGIMTTIAVVIWTRLYIAAVDRSYMLCVKQSDKHSQEQCLEFCQIPWAGLLALYKSGQMQGLKGDLDH